MKWPGGGYREQIEEGEARNIFKPEELVRVKRLFSDTDKIIGELGYDQEVATLVTGGRNLKGEDQTKRLRIIGEVFLQMIEMGYSVQELRS